MSVGNERVSMEPQGCERHRWVSREAEWSFWEKRHRRQNCQGSSERVGEGASFKGAGASKSIHCPLADLMSEVRGHAVRASSGFVSRQLPAALDRYLTALPAMSLIPVAPFLSYHKSFRIDFLVCEAGEWLHHD